MNACICESACVYMFVHSLRFKTIHVPINVDQCFIKISQVHK